MDVALIKDAENDVHRQQRRQNQEWFVDQRSPESFGGTLKTAEHAAGQAQIVCRLLDSVDRFSERNTWSQIERDRDGRELTLTVDRQRNGLSLEAGESIERHGSARR